MWDFSSLLVCDRGAHIVSSIIHRYSTSYSTFRKVVIFPELLFCEMAFQPPLFSNIMSFSSETNCVHQWNDKCFEESGHLSFYWPYENSFQKVVILPELLFSEESCLYQLVFQKVNKTQLTNFECIMRYVYSRMLFLSSQ